MRKILSAVLALCLLALVLSACSAPYAGDARMGEYISLGPDGETVVYRVTLDASGKGEMIHYPTIGGETREEIFFTFDNDVLRLHGTEVVGGVIGRNEFYGTVALASDHSANVGNQAIVYAFELYSSQTHISLGNFVQVR